jgi:hypothetical protein
MAAIRVVLYQDNERTIELTGTSDPGNGTYSLTALVVPSNGATATLTLVTSFDGDIAAHLVALDATNTVFRFNAAVTVSV